ncbi:MAG: hypothetical protein B0D96_11985 [Candidatus Sedimenticola endophacoides]|nr:MAG: hypothetical protein B0D94_05750 [Candidatus Sedimenticola endophacoides]OQX32423.1 MAG: hypothetical protein B0D84_06265 [Candidatus Sedimenticola endophacoides]OQX33245.1 MAG: hypothetical protein B0D96_11985 [Candidatus Sedimenticola endophacoides]OQX40199.1 MAG: hypothetical protein B0D89_08655 [Candidatus Sedimenticola endophacoides]OQX49367.1 MAG: hypothetical protein B0D87_00740 [Candidatus Sedimenticola endophacoides]
MAPQIEQITENRRFSVPLHPGQKIAAKALALTSVLQTTLEINQLMALFFQELEHTIPFDGLYYDFPASAIDIKLGVQSGHSCSYTLEVASEALGEIRLFRHQRFAEEELETIENMLVGLLFPLRNTLLYQRALQSAIIDPLTGAKNRAALDGSLQREVDLAHRHTVPLSLILFDIDHFKRVNDRHGHLLGDQALRAIADCAQRTIRDSDLLFRYGGEEFLVLLTNTGLSGAQMLAERIRRSIEQAQPVIEAGEAITISLGVASLLQNEGATDLFQRADQALYQAKHQGRNRVIAAT